MTAPYLAGTAGHHVRAANIMDLAPMTAIWHDALEHTHDFLPVEVRCQMGVEIKDFLKRVSPWVAVNNDDLVHGFMVMRQAQIDALFVANDMQGVGVGSLLLQFARSLHPVLTTDAYEGNEAALAFYRRRGFECVGRSSADGRGRPYPLVHLKSDHSGAE